jgi:hypothetical protein
LQDAKLEVEEDCGTAQIVVRRFNGARGRISCKYFTRNDTALAGRDYEGDVSICSSKGPVQAGLTGVSTLAACEGTLVFEDGEMEKVINVVIVDDDQPEPDEKFRLILNDVGPEVSRAASCFPRGVMAAPVHECLRSRMARPLATLPRAPS